MDLIVVQTGSRSSIVEPHSAVGSATIKSQRRSGEPPSRPTIPKKAPIDRGGLGFHVWRPEFSGGPPMSRFSRLAVLAATAAGLLTLPMTVQALDVPRPGTVY